MSTTTKLTKLSPATIAALAAAGLALEATRSYAELAGDRTEALAAVDAALLHLQADDADMQVVRALGTAGRKLAEADPRYVTTTTVAVQPDDQPADEHGHDVPASEPGTVRTAGKRAPLRDGYVTPVGLTKEINARGLYTGRRTDGLTSQSMYVYIKSNGEGMAHPFPIEVIDGRQCVDLEAGIAWWVAKEARVAARGTTASTTS